jgi:membrane-bound ClpP family serine protease
MLGENMLIFIAIALASFLLVAGSFLFGGDDGDHADDVDHEGHDIDHGLVDSEPVIGFFSPRVIGTLTMGFGAAGAIARYYGASNLVASLWGLGTGTALATVMYQMMKLIYKQQASSLVDTETAIGKKGVVTTAIDANATGEVSMTVGGQYQTYLAKSYTGQAIAKGITVKVVSVVGSQLVVEKV